MSVITQSSGPVSEGVSPASAPSASLPVPPPPEGYGPLNPALYALVYPRLVDIYGASQVSAQFTVTVTNALAWNHANGGKVIDETSFLSMSQPQLAKFSGWIIEMLKQGKPIWTDEEGAA
jgi:hypothetical protein